MNRVSLIGRLTKDPEIKMVNGKAVANFVIAIDRKVANKDGVREADFVPIIVWGKQAESTAKYVNKGKLIGIGGRIQTRSYEGKDNVTKYITEIIAEEVQFLEWKGQKSSDHDQNKYDHEEKIIDGEA